MLVDHGVAAVVQHAELRIARSLDAEGDAQRNEAALPVAAIPGCKGDFIARVPLPFRSSSRITRQRLTHSSQVCAGQLLNCRPEMVMPPLYETDVACRKNFASFRRFSHSHTGIYGFSSSLSICTRIINIILCIMLDNM